MDDLPRHILHPLRLAALAVFMFSIGAGLWSAMAPIATTLRVSGALTSTRPSFEIQHPFGGAVSQVLVALHDTVQVGQPLLVLDTETQRQTRAAILTQINLLVAENELITQILSNRGAQSGDAPPELRRYYQEQQSFQTLRVASKNAAIDAKTENAEFLAKQMDLVRQRITLLQKRLDKNADLAARGILTKTDQDSLRGQILALYGALEDQGARAVSTQNEIRATELELKSMAAEYHLSLSEKLTSNLKGLPQLRIQALKLAQEIDAGQIVAPIAGLITTQEIIAPGMVAQRGQTLMTLAQPLFEPKVTLKIPVINIDQVVVGQTGKLTLTPLPQRNAPNLEVTIINIAPQATRDRDDNPAYYLAEARLNKSDLAQARALLGDQFRLATDMPVSVALKGRNTTFSSFLFRPFTDIFSAALQDS